MGVKQQLDEIRTLAIKLFEAGEAVKRKQPKHIWEGQMRYWHNLPSESVAVWDAVAICAYDQLRTRFNNAKLLKACESALRSYQHGNTATELAEKVADKVRDALGEKSSEPEYEP